MVHTSDYQKEQQSLKGAIMRTYLPPPRMPYKNSRADHHVKAPYTDTCPQEARLCLSPSTNLKADPNAPLMNLLLSELLQIPQEPEGHQALLDNSTPQMPAAAAAAAAVAANSAAHQPCVAAAGSRRLQPGPRSQSATCWSPDEEGSWSRSAWCPTAAAAVGGAWVSWSGWRGGRDERLFLVKLLRGGRDGTQMGCSGLAPSPKSRLRGALTQ